MLVLSALLACGSAARADAWEDAKRVFRLAQRSDDLAVRRDGYVQIGKFDGEESAGEILRAVVRERSPAVRLTAIQALAALRSKGAVAALERSFRSEKGMRRVPALLALADRTGEGGDGALLEALADPEPPVVAQAAIALGRRQVKEAVPALTALLESPAWQLRAAAARGLRLMAGGAPTGPGAGAKATEPPPAWMDVKALVRGLATSLATAEGRDRAEIVEALERLTLLPFGHDPSAWRRVAEGADPKTVTPTPAALPYICGIPILGRKVVLAIDTGSRTAEGHPFRTVARLKEVSDVPGARPVAWYEVRTTKQFFAAHARRCILDLPAGTKFDVFAVFQKVEPLFGRLTPVNAGTQERAVAYVESLTANLGSNHYVALDQALDLSGTKDEVAWSLGPDEIVFLTCSIPFSPKEPVAYVTEDEVGAAIGLKARLRMVPVHTIGVGPHPFLMMRVMSEQSGGRYVDLSR